MPNADKPTQNQLETDRREMVEVAAYYLAERRGFEGDHQRYDWMCGEAEITHAFGPEPTLSDHT